MYGGKNIAAARKAGRKATVRRRQKRADAGLCTLCGSCPPAPNRMVCEPCGEVRRDGERERMADRIERGQCVKCPRAARPGKTTCAEHADRAQDREKKNARARERYSERRSAGLCTDCGEPAPGGAARCDPCAARSYARMMHRHARAAFDLGAGFAGHDGSEAHSIEEAREAR